MAPFYSQIIASIIGIIMLSIILIYHGISTYNHTQPKTNQSQSCKKLCRWPSLLVWSFLMPIIGILYCISGLSEILWTEYESSHPRGRLLCFMHFLLLLNLYGLFKLSLYMALCRRLVESYSESSLYSYANRFYVFWQIFLLVVSLGMIVASGVNIDAQYDPNVRPPCVIFIPHIVVLILIGYEVVVSVVNMLLFIKPLWKLTADLYDQSSRIRNAFKSLMYTNAILASVTIITSVCVWILVYFVAGMEVLFQTIDIVVSSGAIVLLFSRNHWIFRSICCCMKIYQMKEPPPPTALVELSQ